MYLARRTPQFMIIASNLGYQYYYRLATREFMIIALNLVICRCNIDGLRFTGLLRTLGACRIEGHLTRLATITLNTRRNL
jgi:hypothetical protein